MMGRQRQGGMTRPKSTGKTTRQDAASTLLPNVEAASCRFPAASSYRENRGMTLLGTLAYVAILAVLINLSMSVFVSASRLSALSTAALERLNTVDEVRVSFTRTVREARGVSPGVGVYKSGPTQLVLDMPLRPEDGGTARYAVFAQLKSPTQLSRLEVIEKDGALSPGNFSTYALPVEAVRFEYDAQDPERARLVTFDLDVENAGKNANKPPVTYRFLASPRGKGALAIGGETS